ncbi:hypothetical protein [Paenibacillus sanfengchensis]|uniref:hypothetical protein n=1 Tax=Paenibacillus sanfengchensis TaxID=3119819 RepID=UPI002FE12DD1
MKNKELEKIEKRNFWKDETGDIGVKQIAMTVAVIVIIAFIVLTLKGGLLTQWINEVWNYLFNDLIKDNIGGGAS